MGPFDGGVARGSGEAHSVSDIRFNFCVACSIEVKLQRRGHMGILLINRPYLMVFGFKIATKTCKI